MRRAPRHRVLAAIFLLAVLAVAPSPAAAANKEHQQMMADIRMLQEQQARLDMKLNTLLDALKAVTVKLDESTGANRKMLADQKLLIDNLASDLRVVREKADDNNVRLGTLSQDVESIHQSLVQASASSPGGAAPVGGAVPGAGATPPAGGAGQPVPPPRPGELPSEQLRQAVSDYQRGNFDLAITGFEQYLAANPKASDAADTQVKIGDSHKFMGRFNEAVAAYTKVINNYPNSSKVPEAYYKRGQAYEAAGDKARATEDYDFLIKNFPPDNMYALLAKQARDRLQGKGQEDANEAGGTGELRIEN